jgi:hypothetical protein
LDADFDVQDAPELAERLRTVAHRYLRAVQCGIDQGIVTLGISTGACASRGSSASAWETPSGVRMSTALGTVAGSTKQMVFPAATSASVQTPNKKSWAVGAKSRAALVP